LRKIRESSGIRFDECRQLPRISKTPQNLPHSTQRLFVVVINIGLFNSGWRSSKNAGNVVEWNGI